MAKKEGRIWEARKRQNIIEYTKQKERTKADIEKLYKEHLNKIEKSIENELFDTFYIDLEVPNKELANLLFWKLRTEGHKMAGVYYKNKRARLYFGPKILFNDRVIWTTIGGVITFLIIAFYLILLIWYIIIF